MPQLYRILSRDKMVMEVLPLNYQTPPHPRWNMRWGINGVEILCAAGCLATSMFVVEGLHNSIIPAVLIFWIASAFTPIALVAYRARIKPPDQTMRRTVRIILLLLAPGSLLGGARIYSSLVYGDPHNILRGMRNCADHLHEIGSALIAYAAQHDGRLPDSLSELPFPTAVLPSKFVCPSASDTPPISASELDAPGHCSYVYLGKGLTNTESFDTVLMYEPLGNHPRAQQMNVLFGDGHVEPLSETEAQNVLSQERSGVHPIRWPTTRPSTSPSL